MEGGWPFIPPRAHTIGSSTTLNADFRSWWNDGCGLTAEGGYFPGSIVWQKFIVRLVLHGPIVPEIPSSILRLASCDFVIAEPVAEDFKIELIS